MQLVFTVEEFRLLNHVLRNCGPDLQDRPQLRSSAPQLLQKLLAHDFGFSLDELEDLEEIMKLENDRLRQLPAAQFDNEPEEVSHRLMLLERIIDRVTEACAMA